MTMIAFLVFIKKFYWNRRSVAPLNMVINAV